MMLFTVPAFAAKPLEAFKAVEGGGVVLFEECLLSSPTQALAQESARAIDGKWLFGPDGLCCAPSAVCALPGRQPARRARAAPAFTQVNSLPDVHSWENDSQPRWKFLTLLSSKMPLVRIDAATLTAKVRSLSRLGSGTQMKQIVLMRAGSCPLECPCSLSGHSWSLPRLHAQAL